MKRVMRKIFVSVLALAMIVGIIGVQKMSVSAADIKYYSHVDIKASVDVQLIKNVTYDGGEKEDEIDEGTIKASIVEDTLKVILNYGIKAFELEKVSSHNEDGNLEYGFVLDGAKVRFDEKAGYYKHVVKGNLEDFKNNEADGRFGNDFDSITITAELDVENQEENLNLNLNISNKDVFANNKCSGKGEDKYRGIDLYLVDEDKEEDKFVWYDFQIAEVGSYADGRYDGYARKGQSAIVPPENPTLEGYEFVGWSKWIGASVATEDFTVSEPTTFYAVFKNTTPVASVALHYTYFVKDMNDADPMETETSDGKYSSVVTVPGSFKSGDLYTVSVDAEEGDFKLVSILPAPNEESKITLQEGPNIITIKYLKTIAKNEVIDNKEEDKPIIPDYIPVVPIEEKKEEVIEIIEEEVPEAPVEEPVEEEEEVVEEIEVEIPEIPEALPKTGTASAELFFGLGSFFMTIGAAFVLFARRKN